MQQFPHGYLTEKNIRQKEKKKKNPSWNTADPNAICKQMQPISPIILMPRKEKRQHLQYTPNFVGSTLVCCDSLQLSGSGCECWLVYQWISLPDSSRLVVSTVHLEHDSMLAGEAHPPLHLVPFLLSPPTSRTLQWMYRHWQLRPSTLQRVGLAISPVASPILRTQSSLFPCHVIG